MKPSELLQYVVVAAIIGLILVLLFSQLLGQPFLVFVETGSMEPTLEPNDGYLAIPSFFGASIQEGDVILFDAQELGGGELTTHRVVGQTQEGYITKGDANPFTDQDGDEPPVAEGQIRSVAVQMNGDLVVIPGLGASVGVVTGGGEWFQDRVLEPIGIDTDVTTLSTAVLVGGLLLFVYSTVTGSTDDRIRSRSQGSILQNAVVVVAILTLVVIIPVNFSMLLPSGVYQYEILSSTSPTDDERIIQAGGSSEVTYFMRNSGHLPTVVFLEPAGDGVEIHQERTYLPRRTTVETSITMHAPEETGTYLRFVREHRYLVVLPPSLIASLHHIHPLVALAAINLWVATIVIVIGVLSVGTGRVRLRSRRRDLTFGERLRRGLPIVAYGEAADTPSGVGSLRSIEPDDGPLGSVDGVRTDGTEGRPPGPGRSGWVGRGDWTGKGGSVPMRDDDEWAALEAPNGTSADRLSDEQLIEVHRALLYPPSASGIEADRWTPELLAAYLSDTYGKSIHPRKSARLMRRSGIEREGPQ